MSKSAPPRQATNRFLVEYEGFALAYGSDIVDIRWYRLRSDRRPVARVQPNKVPVEPYPGLEEAVQVWPVARRRMARHPPAPRAPPVADAGVDAAAALCDGERSADEGAAPDVPNEEEAEPRGVLGEALRFSDELVEAEFAFEPPSEAAAAPSEAPAPCGRLAGSSREPAPPPPAPIAPRGAEASRGPGVGPRRGADVTMQCPGGSISFYAKKMAFEAVCDNAAHMRCVATRTCRARAAAGGGPPRGGRPVGFLAAWLSAGQDVATKEEHWQLFNSSVADRLNFRREISKVESGRLLLSRERPCEAGEPEEPVSLDGYI